MSAADATTIEDMPFEAAMAELETIVRQLESGSAPLDQAVDTYERGIALKRHCEAKLRQAQAKIDKLNISADGQVAGAAPLDTE
ncbi:MAG: exodeoxyribonuclease VII small subunit [Pseudomonadota bacterium]